MTNFIHKLIVIKKSFSPSSPPQRWLSMPAVLHPSCWERRYLPSPRTWTVTPTACPSGCVRVLPLLTSLPWFLSGCFPSAWYVATPTWWSPLNGSQDVPCSWPKCSRMQGHQMVHSTSSTANTQVSVCWGVCWCVCVCHCSFKCMQSVGVISNWERSKVDSSTNYTPPGNMEMGSFCNQHSLYL